MATLRSRFIDIVSDLRDAFPHSNVSNRCVSMLDTATAPDRPVSRWMAHSKRGMEAQTWDAALAIVDFRNTVALAHREGFLDSDDFKAFEVIYLEYKDELKGEVIVDAFAALQKALRRDARRIHRGI